MSNIYNLNVNAYKPVILLAPLDWGLGHATRGIPLVRILQEIGCEVIIGGSSSIHSVYGKEFDAIKFLELPSVSIQYGSEKNLMGLQFLRQMPDFLTNIKQEQRVLSQFARQNRIDGILSDNRFGCSLPGISSVFITHQLAPQTPFGGTGNFFARKINYRLIRNFQQVWVPDLRENPGMAGRLSHPQKMPAIPVFYGGPLQRMRRKLSPQKYDLLLLLSGPEPQRSILENLLRIQTAGSALNILLIRGIPQAMKPQIRRENNLQVLDYANTDQLEQFLSESNLVVCRTGYSTVMDLMAIQKKAIMIPTPGQPEQEYLGKHLMRSGLFYVQTQGVFNLNKALAEAETFYGAHSFPEGTGPSKNNWAQLITKWISSLPRQEGIVSSRP